MATSSVGPLLVDSALMAAPGAPSAAADQGHLDRVVLGGVDGRNRPQPNADTAAIRPEVFRNSRRDKGSGGTRQTVADALERRLPRHALERRVGSDNS